MINELKIPLFDLIVCLADAMDKVNPHLSNHHKRVAYIASSLAIYAGKDEKFIVDIIMAGILHDIGAMSLSERMEALNFETSEANIHSEAGYKLLGIFKPFSHLAETVRYHHKYWNDNSSVFPEESHLLHISDRISVLIDEEKEILGQVPQIVEKISENSGRMFSPEYTDVFREVAKRQCFWFDLVSSNLYRILKNRTGAGSIMLDLGNLQGLAELFGRIIDYRSRFTATHSKGVAATAAAIARIMGFSDREQIYMKIAGSFHDLGKLAVSKEILEKNGRLSQEERRNIESHTYHTFHILNTVGGMRQINEWASFHHEKLNGRGYPFHHSGEDLSLGSRIMSVADIFTACSEDRPYRKGMDIHSVLKILDSEVKLGALDSFTVSILRKNISEIDKKRIDAQKSGSDEYNRLFVAN